MKSQSSGNDLAHLTVANYGEKLKDRKDSINPANYNSIYGLIAAPTEYSEKKFSKPKTTTNKNLRGKMFSTI